MLVADDNKEVAGIFTDHPDLMDFQRIHKVASINTLVHTPHSHKFCIKWTCDN
jgi:hypothetical protein